MTPAPHDGIPTWESRESDEESVRHIPAPDVSRDSEVCTPKVSKYRSADSPWFLEREGSESGSKRVLEKRADHYLSPKPSSQTPPRHRSGTPSRLEAAGVWGLSSQFTPSRSLQYEHVEEAAHELDLWPQEDMESQKLQPSSPESSVSVQRTGSTMEDQVPKSAPRRNQSAAEVWDSRHGDSHADSDGDFGADEKPGFSGRLHEESCEGSGDSQVQSTDSPEESTTADRSLLEPRSAPRKVQPGEGLAALLNLHGICARAVPSRHPCACASCGMMTVVVICTLGCILAPPVVESDFSAFMKTDVESSLRYEGFLAALEQREDGARRLGFPLYHHLSLFTAYELNDGQTGSLFTPAVLSEIARFENRLTGLDAWVSMCSSVDEKRTTLCESGVSIANYGLPQLETATGHIVPSALQLNGAGVDRVPLETLFGTAIAHEVTNLVLPVEFGDRSAWELTAEHEQISTIRSAFRFKIYCCESDDTVAFQDAVIAEQKQQWHSLIVDHVLDVLQNPQPEGTDEQDWAIRVWYDGSELEIVEVFQTLMSDVMLAVGSMCFVLVYMTLHTRSVFLSLFGLLVICVSIPFSYVFFFALSHSQTVSIASFLSVFLIVGLGADVVFVYTDCWKRSEEMDITEAERFVCTYTYAGKATFVTTVTTALSFFANLASVLKSLREFGVFMGICVALVWVLVSLLYVPMCSVESRHFKKLRLRCACSSQARAFPLSSSWSRWTSFLQPWRRTVSGWAMFVAVLFLVFALCFAEVDSTVPNLFPENHNRNRGQKVFDRFQSPDVVFPESVEPAPSTAYVCHPSDISSLCGLSWCEVTTTAVLPVPEDGVCHCQRRERLGTCATTLTANLRFVGLSSLTQSDLEIIDRHLLGGLAEVEMAERLSNSVGSPCMLEEWESAEYSTYPTTDAKYSLVKHNSSDLCELDQICFCESTSCMLVDGWNRVNDLVLGDRRLVQDSPDAGVSTPEAQRRRELVPERFLQNVANVPVTRSEDRVSVNVVFGLNIEEGAPLLGTSASEDMWSFSGSFDAKMPWAQRNMMTFCTQLFSNLLVVEKLCWLEEFEAWLGRRQIRFPVPSESFHSLVSEFKSQTLTGVESSNEFLWTRSGELKACYMSFKVDFSKNAQIATGLEYKQRWDDYVDHFNSMAEPVTQGAFHASQDWVRLDAQSELVSSTVVTLVIVLCLAFSGMLLFTLNLVLSFFVVVGTVQVICGLAFFMVCIMSWSIGPVEIIALIIFIGYSVTYSLHIAHKYGEVEPPDASDAEIRQHRTTFALRSIGAAAFGSAATTVGSAVFLLFCQLSLFLKLGGVVLAVTVLSIVTALVTLTAALLMAGPTQPGCVGQRTRSTDLQSFTLQSLIVVPRVQPESTRVSRLEPDEQDDEDEAEIVDEVEEDFNVGDGKKTSPTAVSLGDVHPQIQELCGDIGTERSLGPICVHERNVSRRMYSPRHRDLHSICPVQSA